MSLEEANFAYYRPMHPTSQHEPVAGYGMSGSGYEFTKQS
jgi:hypothetical protein